MVTSGRRDVTASAQKHSEVFQWIPNTAAKIGSVAAVISRRHASLLVKRQQKQVELLLQRQLVLVSWFHGSARLW